MEYNIKYDLVFPENKDVVHFKIAEGTFQGTEFLIDTIRLQEDGEEIILKFDLDVVKGDKTLEDDVDFCKLVGDIIVQELKRSVASKDFELKKTNDQ